FILQLVNNQADEIVGYNEVIDHLNMQLEDEFEQERTGVKTWKFRRITGHRGPIKPSDPKYMGSKYNVMVEWETGEITEEPLNMIGRDDPVTVALYAKEKGLLDTDGWRMFKRRALRQKKLLREIKQAQLRQVRRSVRYKFGYQIPNNYDEAMELDKQNGNSKWKESVALELGQIDEYKTFIDQGHKSVAIIPEGYKRIFVHLVFDVKHDGRHKARLVAAGNLTAEPVESVYSGVVSLRSLRLIAFLAELNQLELWGADIGNAYLKAKTKEKLYIIAGPEFGEREGHVLLIDKALYGLKTSGKRWFERFAGVLRELGFTQCRADTSIWMRKAEDGSCWEYVATYVDDIMCAMKNPRTFLDQLIKDYKFKLKGDGPIDYHLGLNYARDKDGTLYTQPAKYIEKMMDTYKRLFDCEPKTAKTPLEKGDHPEIDD
ncbi:MAG: reverse transcriptase domain-containing protein, partial [Halieaceae bacterium]|nr:reverse transcriptase domain-containing protein [Halieaceae bacterium]